MKAWLIPISLCLLAETARADQCAWIDDAAAQKAQSILKKSPKYLEYCEPCGDKAPGIPQVAKTVEVQAAGGQYQEVSINGKAIDLAYVFVKTDDATYKNLAKLASCPAEGVSPTLSIEDETPNGVIITADDDSFADPPPPPPPPQMTEVTAVPSYMPAAPPAPPAQVYVYTTTTHQIPWLAIMFAAAGGFVTGSALTFGLVALRRRRDMRPRAVDIGG